MSEPGWGKGVGGRAARVWAVALAVTFLVVGAIRTDTEAIAFGVGTLVAAALTLVRKGLAGRVVLALVSLNTLVWMIPAAVANVREAEQFADVAVPAVLSALALAVLGLVVGVKPAPVLIGGGVLLVAAVVVGVVASSSGETIRADERVEMKNVEFSTDEISVAPGDTIAVKNRDLFWHTFTVSDLDVDVRVPTGATRVVTIDADAPEGEYRFVCQIPGHDSTMKGTLTVSGS